MSLTHGPSPSFANPRATTGPHHARPRRIADCPGSGRPDCVVPITSGCAGRASQHQLRLRDLRHEPAAFVAQPGFPDLGAPAAMQRNALRDQPGADRRTGEEVRLALHRRRGLPLTQIQHRADRADRVGERHDRAAVNGVAKRAVLLPHHQFRDHAFRRRVGDGYAQQPRQPDRSQQLRRFHRALPHVPWPSCRSHAARPRPLRHEGGIAMTDHAETTVRRIMDSAAFRTAHATLAQEHDRTVQDIVTLTQIAAPSFQEETRAAAYLEMAKAHGLTDLEIDAEGNVTGMRRGIGNGPLICVAAHLDTVFPAGTDLTVRREGTKLFAPGVGDDTRGLAVLLAWLRALDAAAIRTSAFITVDSPDMDRIATGGVGSKRYRVTFNAPGGHSYGAFGVVNPMYAMADTIARLSRVTVPARPKTTFSASVTGGGTSINAIPN